MHMNNSIFINISNHPSALWSARQRESAENYGWVMDIPFPEVDAHADENEIRDMADRLFADIIGVYMESVGETDRDEILRNGVSDGTLTVMVQGEFTLTFALIERLKEIHAVVVAACSQRVVHEEQMERGKSRKVVEFEFVRFREYT